MSLTNPDFNANLDEWTIHAPKDDLLRLRVRALVLEECLASLGYFVTDAGHGSVWLGQFTDKNKQEEVRKRLQLEIDNLSKEIALSSGIHWEGTSHTSDGQPT